jgi:hypothetical protein
MARVYEGTKSVSVSNMTFMGKTYHPQNRDERPVLGEMRIVSQVDMFDYAFFARGDWTHGAVVRLLLSCRHIES